MQGALPKRKGLIVAEACLFLVGLAFAVCWSLRIAVYAVLNPLLGLTLLVLLPLSAGALGSYSLNPARWKLILTAAVAVFATAATIVPWDHRQVFVRRLHGLIGKPKQAVYREMRDFPAGKLYPISSRQEYVPDDLTRLRPTQMFMFHCTDDPGDADLGEVFLRDDRVVGVRFLPD